MKTIYILTTLLSLSLLLQSCSQSFLDTAPTSDYDETFVFSTMENAYAALNGMHKMMVDVMETSPGNQDKLLDHGGYPAVMITMEALGEDFVFPNVKDNLFISDYQWNDHRKVDGKKPAFIYKFFYQLIANANKILEQIDQVSGADNTRNLIKGEALAYRAFSHFWLVQLFAKRYDNQSSNAQAGVPLVMKSDIRKLARSSVASVYQQVIEDLEHSITLLSEKNIPERTYKTHFNAAVVKGLRARVALTMQDWKNARKYSQEAIKESECTLMDRESYRKGFNNVTNSEWLWGFLQLPDQSLQDYSFAAFMCFDNSSISVQSTPKCISQSLYERIPASDIRKELWMDPDKAAWAAPSAKHTMTPYMNRKFLTKGSKNLSDVCFMRLSELYLILAEAQARLNDKEAGKTLYDLVKTRDPEYRQSNNTGTALIEEILFQRRCELWGEGFRFTDLKRLNQSLDRTNSNHEQSICIQLTTPAGDKAWEYLFPESETNANELIEQNP